MAQLRELVAKNAELGEKNAELKTMQQDVWVQSSKDGWDQGFREGWNQADCFFRDPSAP